MPDDTTTEAPPEVEAEVEPEAEHLPPTPPPTLRKRAKAPKLPRMVAGGVKRQLAFDCSEAVEREQAELLFAAGYRTAIRYVDRVLSNPDVDDRWPINLTRPELAMLLDVGFDVGLVQYYSTSYESTGRGERICGAYGEQMGAIAAANALALGTPEQVEVFCDAEHWPRLRSRQHGLDYLQRFADAVKVRGLAPGIYVGPNLGSQRVGWLTGPDLWSIRGVRAYWGSAAVIPQLPRRGYTLTQMTPIVVAGLQLDQNSVRLDHNWPGERYRFKVIRAAAA